MTGEITSPATGVEPALPMAGSAKQEWLRFAQYIKRPRLPVGIAASDDATRGTLRMLALDLIIMATFIVVLLAIVQAGFELPENLNASLELNLLTVALVVVIAPVMEELAFRSWLTGRPAMLAAIAALLMSGAIAAGLAVTNPGEAGQLAVALSLLGGLVFAIIALVALRKRATPSWFRTIFPGAFWASSVAFALVHLLNYTEGALAILLPLVIPQFILGTIAAYVRVHYGLLAAFALHGLHNGFALGLAALAMKGGAG